LICNPPANDHKPCGVMKFSNLFRSRPADESSMCTAIAELVMRRLTWFDGATCSEGTVNV
jgi:hypothetical protein